LGSRVRVQSLPLFTSACLAELDSLDYHEERLALFDDVCSELRGVAAADVLHRVDRFGRDEQDVAGFERRGRPALDPVLQRPFEDVDDLFARMLVPDEWRLRANVDAVLDDLASGDAQIVPLEVGAPDPRRLLHGAAHVSSLVLLLADIMIARRAPLVSLRRKPGAARTARARRSSGRISALT
jgi:hypothetical protein